MLSFLATTLAAVLPAVSSPADTVPLFDGLGDLRHEVTTSSPLAQRYFDQGMRWTYAFNHAEAIRSFEQAARLDADCAMCWWGIAWASGPNINLSMDPESATRAYAAIRRAGERLDGATDRERAYVAAMAARYAVNPVPERAAMDSAYARAVEEVHERWPDDPDAAVLAAEARMLLSPWDYWAADGSPKPGTAEILATLEDVIARFPEHPGGCHFYIHAVEAVHPDRAVACAERLAGLMPAAGHVVHMPGHIYVRVGRYGDAVEANRHAVHVDEEYIADQRPTGIYPGGYYPHNYHFMAFAALMDGQGATAIEAARKLREKIDPELVHAVYFMEQMPAYPSMMEISFGRWEDALAEPEPPAEMSVASGMDAYARVVALAATGRCEEARAGLDVVRERAVERSAGPATPAAEILPIAVHAGEGEVALRCGDPAGAVTHFRAARDLEDALLYDEPPLWYYPIRHSLGRALLEAGRPSEAEVAYREDLERFPENGWALSGLAAALEAQGRTAEAAGVRERFARAWARSDVTLTGSRF